MSDVPEEVWGKMRETLETIVVTHMPFGKYGPDHFPPNGLPIDELPAEYLIWFQNKGGFPKGKLGFLLAAVLEIKQTGAEVVFEKFRKAQGRQRTPLRQSRRGY